MSELKQKKIIVKDFLSKCNEYAQSEILALQNECNKFHEENDLKKDLKLKISKWQSYHEFNTYTICQLQEENSCIDHYFESHS